MVGVNTHCTSKLFDNKFQIPIGNMYGGDICKMKSELIEYIYTTQCTQLKLDLQLKEMTKTFTDVDIGL